MKKNYIDIYNFFIKERLTKMWLFLGLAVVLALLGAPIPYLFGYLIDKVIPLHDTDLLSKIIILLALLMLLQAIFSYLNAILTFKIKKEITVETTQLMLNGIFKMPHEKRTSIHSGELISRLTRDINELYFILPFGIANLAYHLLFTLIMAGILILLNWKLSVMLFLLLPFIGVIYLLFNKALWEYAFKDADASANNMKYLNEVIAADYEIKSYGAENTFKKLAMKAVSYFQTIHYQRLVINEKMGAFVNLLPVIATIIVWYFASLLAIQKEITIGLIITYTTTISLIVPSLMQIVEYISEYPNQIAMLRRIQEFAVSPIDISKQQNNPTVENIKSLQLSDVSFSYQEANKKIFNGFSYTFEKGKTYLIKAPNGFGKSTLFSLINGQLKPSHGQILLDNLPLESISETHKYITLLPQHVNIISDTIRCNLNFGDTSITDKEIINMLDHLGLTDWLNEKESGLDHVLASSQKQLSGGQVQRIGLARALLRKTSILLLDEPTNNLDNNAVNHLIDTITSLNKYTICLVISHDDRIYPHVDTILDLSY